MITKLTYVKGLKERGKSYSEEQVKCITAIWARHSLTHAMQLENNAVGVNSEQLYDLTYPESLPVYIFLSSLTVKGDDEWESLHREAFSNSSIQMLTVLEGEHYLHWTQAEEIAQRTDYFLENIQ